MSEHSASLNIIGSPQTFRELSRALREDGQGSAKAHCEGQGTELASHPMTSALSAAPVDAREPAARDGLAIDARQLTKTFDTRTAVDHVELHVPRGTAFGLLGPNGAGKTTLMRMLLGMTNPTSGSAFVLGNAIPEAAETALARVGAIVEEPKFHPFLTGRENLRIVAAVRDDAAMHRIDDALARVGLSERANEKVSKYSLGMRQRLGVARCLLPDPELLILDEPMNGLDPAGMEEFRVLIGRLVDEGRTVLLSSHLLDEVEKTCDSIAIIDNGSIVRQGRIADIAAGEAGTVTYRVTCSDPTRAHEILSAMESIHSVSETPDGLMLELGDTSTSPAAANRALVTAGIGVTELSQVKVSLESRFLELTSRLGGKA